MEHLLFTGAPAPIVFPYLCTEDWDGGDFLTYPQRKGWEIQPWDSWDRELPLDTAGHTFNEIATFLQTWLFFGLLESVLGVKVPKEDFTCLKEVGKVGHQVVITTKRLKHYLEEWRRRISRLSEVDRESQGNVIWACLGRAIAANQHLNLKFCTEDIPGSEPLLESVFCQTLLEHALRRALTDMLPGFGWAIFDYPYAQKLLTEKMVAAGWCPYAVEFLEDELQPDAQAFIFSLNSLRAQEDHSLCKSAGFKQIGRQCVAHQTDGAATSKTKHVTADCECEESGPPMEAIIKTIEEGLIPVITIAISDDSVDVIVYGVEYTEEFDFYQYFAISHVWTDGLGNQEQNTLPLCQIQRLAEYLYTIGDTESGESKIPETDPDRPDRRETVAFWLDIFCIPVQPQFQEYRDRCIGQMHSIYRRAARTIVLDPDVQQITSNSKPIEISARLLASLWRTRLWTYQEGALAIDLYLPGKNCMHHLEKVHNDYTLTDDDDDHTKEMGIPPRTERDLVEYQIGRSLMVSCGQTITALAIQSKLKNDLEDALHLILRAMYQRSTGRPDDETICIATFVGVDPSSLVDTLPQHRMTKLLQIVPCIPRSALFTWGPRQKTAGFRWAPLTFLAPHGMREPVLCATIYAPDPAEPKVTVPIPAAFLHPKGLGLAAFFTGVRFACRHEAPTPKCFSVVTPTGKSYWISFCETNSGQAWEEVSPDKFANSAAILFPWPSLSWCKGALLVEVLGQQTEEEYLQCRWKCLLMANHLDALYVKGKEAETAQTHQFEGESIPYQWLVID
jgi:hypothetical protein